jgi:GT2 family glycosyltransferase
MKKVSIIIVNWNGLNVLKDCLVSLEKLKYKNQELIVVDNGSSDGSIEFLEKYKNKKIILIKNSSNLGFAKANNQGYEKSSGQYILLLNNDTKVTPDLLGVLVNRLEKEADIGVIQPKIYIMDKKDYLDNVGSYLTRLGFLQHIGYMEKDSDLYSNEEVVFSAKGACMLIRREVIEKVGLFDSDFGSYFEESDFCWRVWLSGWKIIFCPKAKIYHKVGFTSKKQNQVMVNYHANKNRICTLIKNLQISNLITIGLLHLTINIGLGIYYLIRVKFSKSWMIWKSIIWNVVYIRKTLEKRHQVSKMRVKDDKEIFRYILKPINWSGMFRHFQKVEANFK